ncbi:insulin-like growth factor binding protein [Anaeramoeba flamelloides]|uniref:Insulin-like growth factor binding protein n=1 Tax=Anaeramoeba flamelloides TaxID=1746091 RepID=A0ABQ8YUX5_9EUKA|nr:insulin-like growth factor binding protein [Anaeramoeba flamelloides]
MKSKLFSLLIFLLLTKGLYFSSVNFGVNQFATKKEQEVNQNEANGQGSLPFQIKTMPFLILPNVGQSANKEHAFTGHSLDSGLKIGFKNSSLDLYQEGEYLSILFPTTEGTFQEKVPPLGQELLKSKTNFLKTNLTIKEINNYGNIHYSDILPGASADFSYTKDTNEFKSTYTLTKGSLLPKLKFKYKSNLFLRINEITGDLLFQKTPCQFMNNINSNNKNNTNSKNKNNNNKNNNKNNNNKINEEDCGNYVFKESRPIFFQGIYNDLQGNFEIEKLNTENSNDNMNLYVVAFGITDQRYNPNEPLIIDPIISSLLGGSKDEVVSAIERHEDAIYLGGTTSSLDFPTTKNVISENYMGGKNDIFITKFMLNETNLVWSTFIGSTEDDRLNDLKLITTQYGQNERDQGSAKSREEGEGAVTIIITGSTNGTSSTNAFPTTKGVLYNTCEANTQSTVVSTISSDGTHFVMSTLLCSAGRMNYGSSVVVDLSLEYITVVGDTYGSFPLGYQIQNCFLSNDQFASVYIAQIYKDGSTLMRCTCLSGNKNVFSSARAAVLVDNISLYVVGSTNSDDLPTNYDSVQQFNAGGYDLWFAKLDMYGLYFLYLSYFGGYQDDYGTSIVQNTLDYRSVIITGNTLSDDIYTTRDCYSEYYNGNGSFNGFFFELDGEKETITYSSYFNTLPNTFGTEEITIWGIGLANNGGIMLTGGGSPFQNYTDKLNFGGYVALFNPDKQTTFANISIGTGFSDQTFAIASLAVTKNLIIAGSVDDTVVFHPSTDAFQKKFQGGDTDSFLTQINNHWCLPGEYIQDIKLDKNEFGTETEHENGNDVACSKCGKGNYTMSYNSKSCDLCPEGTYSNKTGAVECVKCRAGTYSNQRGQADNSTCLLCPPGSYSNEGATQCIPCGAGDYNPNNGSASCEKCPPGTYNPVNGSLSISDCLDCGPGNFSAYYGSSICSLCSTGSYNPSWRQENCISCPPGTYNENEGSKSYQNCLSCPIGTSNSYYGRASCDLCSPGSYNDKVRQTACPSCKSGSVTDSYGATVCQLCSPGYYQEDEDMEYCNQCDYGTYSSNYGSAYCLECSGNTYQDEMGQSYCYDCSEDEISDDDHMGCSYNDNDNDDDKGDNAGLDWGISSAVFVIVFVCLFAVFRVIQKNQRMKAQKQLINNNNNNNNKKKKKKTKKLEKTPLIKNSNRLDQNNNYNYNNNNNYNYNDNNNYFNNNNNFDNNNNNYNNNYNNNNNDNNFNNNNTFNNGTYMNNDFNYDYYNNNNDQNYNIQENTSIN